jgi:hypothetical protein
VPSSSHLRSSPATAAMTEAIRPHNYWTTARGSSHFCLEAQPSP